MVYPLFETALRAAAGRTRRRAPAPRERAVVAVRRGRGRRTRTRGRATAYSPEEIRTVSPDNRMVCFPYPKRMCANIDVDQAAAVLLCSYEAAHAPGVPDDRMVFLHAAADAHDHYFFTERSSLAESPAIAIAVARRARRRRASTLDDVARFDLYSCFPSAVEIAMRRARPRADDDRGRSPSPAGSASRAGRSTTTRPTRSRAMVDAAARAIPTRSGCTTALGWYVTKHAVGVWSTTPPDTAFARVDPASSQAEVDALPAPRAGRARRRRR